jgi:hypothetical protein
MRALSLLAVAAVFAAGGCKKKAPPTASAPAAPVPAADAPAPTNTNYQSGAGVAQNVRNAAKRTVALNDMHTLGQLIEVMYNDGGRMPTAAAIKQGVGRDAPNVAAAINDGSIVLTGTTDHGGLWAYEAGAETSGGVGLVAGSARRMTADEVKQYLGR